jgi:hypothetical protein
MSRYPIVTRDQTILRDESSPSSNAWGTKTVPSPASAQSKGFSNPSPHYISSPTDVGGVKRVDEILPVSPASLVPISPSGPGGEKPLPTMKHPAQNCIVWSLWSVTDWLRLGASMDDSNAFGVSSGPSTPTIFEGEDPHERSTSRKYALHPKP